MDFRTNNPFLQLVLLLGGLLMLGAALMLGAVLLAVFLGIGAILALVVWIRLWLMGGLRGRRVSTGTGRQTRTAGQEHTVIEGEYREVHRGRSGQGHREDPP